MSQQPHTPASSSSSSPALQNSVKFPPQRVVIGRGAFGEVTEAYDMSSGRVVAVKHLRLKESDGSDISRDKVQTLVGEISLMKRLNHPNIVKYIGAFRNDVELSIVMEYIAAGSVARLLRRYGRLPEPVVRGYTRDMVRGLAYLHQHKVAHRDIKCDNLLLCSTGVVKLSDFGSSKEIVGENDVARTVAGTPLFMAPEVALNKGGYDPFLADVWTVGITVIEMLQAEPPFAGRFKQPFEAILHVARTDELPPIPDGISEDCADFLRRCIVREPSGRLSSTELLTHPFIATREGEAGRYPEPPVSGQLRPIATPRQSTPSGTERPSSGRLGLSVPRPPSSQRATPNFDERSTTSSRPSSRDAFGGRPVMMVRPLSGSGSTPSTRPLFGSIGKSPRPHHLPALDEGSATLTGLSSGGEAEDEVKPLPPQAERPTSGRRHHHLAA